MSIKLPRRKHAEPEALFTCFTCGSAFNYPPRWDCEPSSTTLHTLCSDCPPLNRAE